METSENGLPVIIVKKSSPSVLDRMAAAIANGKVASEFGSRYTQANFVALADTMVDEVRALTPGLGFVLPQRQEAIDRQSRETFINVPIKLGSFKKYESRDIRYEELFIGNSISEIKAYSEREKTQMTFRNFLHGALYWSLGNYPFRDYAKVPIHLQFEDITQERDNVFQFVTGPEKDAVFATVKISHRVLPVAQEEYFHAAQELVFGNVEGLRWLDSQVVDASKHITHGSLLIDRILSSAAAEMGPEEFAFWHDKADTETALFNKKFIGKKEAAWEKTLLGKTVNKRFQYPVVDYEELGSMFFNITRDIDAFLLTPEGDIDRNRESLLEVISLQFGPLQYDLMRSLLDLPEAADKNPDLKLLGQRLIAWGKKLLAYYKDRPEAAGLVTHHVHYVSAVDTSHFDYESTHELIRLMNRDIQNGKIPQPVVTLGQLSQLAHEAKLKAVAEILSYCMVKPEASTVIHPPETILRRHGLDSQKFAKLVKQTQHSYAAYLKTRDKEEIKVV